MPLTAHYRTLDALRGLAAIAVMLGHAGASGWGDFGYLAVDLFFMMSGFVVTRAYEYKLLGSLSVARFVRLRVLRLYPALALGVLVAVLCQPPGSSSSAWTVARHLLLIPSLNGGDLFPLNPVFWSLFFELAVNLAHGMGVRWLTTRRLVALTVVCGAAFLAAIWYYRGPGLGWGGSTFAAGFLRAGWGYLIGVLVARWHVPARLPAWPAWCAVGIVVILLFAPNVGFGAIRVLASLFILFPLAVILATEAQQPTTGGRVAVLLGGMSYPLYAVHYPLLVIATTTLDLSAHPWRWAVVLPGIVLAAVAVETLYDAPIRAWLKHRAGRRRRSRESP